MGEAAYRRCAAQDAWLMFVARGPARDIGGFGDLPSCDEAFSDAAVLAD
ncbi:hypothetical protein BZL29_7914 [Mycobacterium kansasii]|uniref:Uncharacterized protein n=1 Tax=Mycobacterium kansasii TaxID=1768 RepID=A0A1V3WEB4_MYCKA|nr:hypothetical protein BZL29_7914 [Mycobacterium kansasii]